METLILLVFLFGATSIGTTALSFMELRRLRKGISHAYLYHVEMPSQEASR